MSMFMKEDGLPPERAVGESRREAVSEQETKSPDPELPNQAPRRRFTAAYKLEILRQVDACEHGEIGAILRREGLYGTYIAKWRRQRDAGSLKALSEPRGRKGPHPLEAELAAARKRAEKAEAELVKARKVIEVQGKVSALLEEMMGASSANSDTPAEGRS